MHQHLGLRGVEPLVYRAVIEIDYMARKNFNTTGLNFVQFGGASFPRL